MWPEDLIPSIEQVALPIQMPDGSIIPAITVEHVEHIAIRFGVQGRTIEIAALENQIIPERYARNFGTYTPDDQIELLNSHVTIVGLGGLGGVVTESLARTGVGHLNLVDGDQFEDHNLNRQLLCTQKHLGRSKAEVAAERVLQINASLNVQAFKDFLNTNNASEQLEGAHVVVDCLDTIDGRFTLQAAARRADIPMVSAAVAGLSGHITTIFPSDPGLELIYGPTDHAVASRGAEVQMGCLIQAVGLIAAAESAEVIKVLLGQHVLRNQMLLIDLTTHSYHVLDLM